ncbi:MAG: hypothetical protein J7545_00770 [Roseofilum sp. SBFL]|uniref:hypothetical protein n=1 Tax=unclassified Roseofilum TaxID=2620099 RepID=UPI001B0AEBBF|nr:MULTISPECIES: hypothetical protein [unclassified Roseofilum]MBP0014394.1 hypothetical protein [Roseofilum sp. SID3]MBP0025959.1 hypothetical protein [Roseofilum sp. SID2]MBP0036131.1 hypothetical protein [Roseofilum sp. SID1]MBP0040499.1 hypothetical protein [Roseofilum sp. SBFL]
MNILIDGCVFGYSGYLEVVKFWQTLIPRIVFYLEGHTIYFLNRSTNAVFPDIAVNHLFAPLPEFDSSGVEICRLSALCQELEIDLFLSTYNTSPGSQSKSLFILEYYQSVLLNNSALDSSFVNLSRQRALKMSCGYFILCQDKDEIPKFDLSLTPNREIWIHHISNKLGDGSAVDINWESLSQDIVKAINKLFDTEISSDVLAQIKAEESLVKDQVQHWRRLTEEQSNSQAFYPVYEPNLNVKKTYVYLEFFLRGYRVLIKPKRYPEFIARIYKWVKIKAKAL